MLPNGVPCQLSTQDRSISPQKAVFVLCELRCHGVRASANPGAVWRILERILKKIR
jgi:hypothetical protein